MLTIPNSIGCLTFSHPVHIIQDLHYPFILGVDFLNKNKANIDFASQQLILPDEYQASHSVCLLSPVEGHARAATSVLIPQHSETNVLVNISNIKNSANVLLEPNTSLRHSKHLTTTTRCLVHVEDGKAMLRILNPTHSAIQLHGR